MELVINRACTYSVASTGLDRRGKTIIRIDRAFGQLC